MGIKFIFCIFSIFILFGCKPNKSNKLLVDAGYFLDSLQTIAVEEKLRRIDEKGYCHLYLYTVIAEKYYTHKKYDEYLFNVLSKDETRANTNVLIYLAYDDRKIRIITGIDASKILTDSLCQVAVNRLSPYMSQGKYYDGINSTIHYIDSVFVIKSQ